MNRRMFLRSLILGLAAVPVAVEATTTPPTPALAPNPLSSGELGVWKGVQWVEKEFDGAKYFGVCYVVQHSITGALRRNAVRIDQREDYPEARRIARRLLRIWADNGAYVSRPFDAVLEGREPLVLTRTSPESQRVGLPWVLTIT